MLTSVTFQASTASWSAEPPATDAQNPCPAVIAGGPLVGRTYRGGVELTPKKEVRSHIDEILRQVQPGESLTLTVVGRPVAEVRPATRQRSVIGDVPAPGLAGTAGVRKPAVSAATGVT